MIYYIVALNNEDVFNEYLSSHLKDKEERTLLIKDNDNIFKKYNSGINTIQKEINDEDIIVFIHEDVKVLDENFEEKLEYTFSTKKDIGMCGVVGATELKECCAWWVNEQDKLVGHIIQESDNKAYHLVKGNVGYSESMISVDGLMLAIRGELINMGLTFIQSFNSFHFYDISIAIEVLEMGYKIACVDTLLRHKSNGKNFLTKEWLSSKEKFITLINERNYKFPLTAEQILRRDNKDEH